MPASRASPDEYGLEIDPRRRVGDLTLGERQRVELIKLLLADARLLIFDEPTSVLAPHEVDGLFRVFSALQADGYSILFITHKVREALAISDHVTVLRRGRVIATGPRADFDPDSLVATMIGTDTTSRTTHSDAGEGVAGETALEFRRVSTRGAGNTRLDKVSFSVRCGEILGVAGVAGNGQRSLGEVLLGQELISSGNLLLFGEPVPKPSAAEMLRRGVAVIPEDPFADAMVPEMRVEDNLLLAGMGRKEATGFWLSRRKITRDAEEMRAAFPLPTAEPGVRVRHLSGGNVQRVLLAGELTQGATALLAYYPTRGLDVVSAESTRGLLREQRDRGSAILLVSEDLDELLSLSDRMIVMFQGRIAGEFETANAPMQQIGLLMTGHEPLPGAG